MKLDVPNDLEVLWVSARPKWLPRQIGSLVICAVYLPPKTATKTVQLLTNYLASTLVLLTKKYSNPLFMIMGDFNSTSTNFKAVNLTKPCKLKQVVSVPTRGNHTLDYIFTNGHRWYKEPTSLPAIGRSDHNTILWVPHPYLVTKQAPKVRVTRKFPDSRLREFGSWITHHDWVEVTSSPSVDDKVRQFQDTLTAKVDYSFPLQKTSMHATDKPWMSTAIKRLIRDRQRAHAMGNFDLRKSLAKRIVTEIRLAKAKFFKEKITLLHNVSPARWFRHISELTSTQPSGSKLLAIPEVAQDIAAAAENINNHFSKYNNTIPPLDRTSLPCFLPHNKPSISISDLHV